MDGYFVRHVELNKCTVLDIKVPTGSVADESVREFGGIVTLHARFRRSLKGKHQLLGS
jgi:hypothetical protein